MQLSFDKIYYIFIISLLGNMFFLAGGAHATQVAKPHTTEATKIVQAEVSQKKIKPKHPAHQKILAWLGAGIFIILPASLLIYRYCWKGKNQERLSGEPGRKSDKKGQDLSYNIDATKANSSLTTSGSDLNENKNDRISKNTKKSNDHEPRMTSKQLAKRKGGFAWENNNCFLSAGLEVLTQIIPDAIPGGVDTIIGWRKQLDERDTSPETTITRLFISLVEDLYNPDEKKVPADRIQKNFRKIREAMAEINTIVNSGGFYDAEVVINLLLSSIDDTFKEDDSVYEAELKYQPGELPSIQDIESIAVMQQSLSSSLPMRSLFGTITLECIISTRYSPYYLLTSRNAYSTRALEAFNMKYSIDHSFLVDSFSKKNMMRDSEPMEQGIIPPPKLLFVTLDSAEKVSYPFDDCVFLREKYKLVSIAIRLGELHIITFIEDPITKKWFKYDGSHVEEIPLKYVKNVYEYNASTWGQPSPSYLFYRRKSSQLSTESQNLKIPLWKGRLRRLSFDLEGTKWFKDYNELKKLSNEKILLKVLKKGITMQLKEKLYQLFDQHCQSLVKFSSKSKSEQESISKLIEKFNKAVAQYGMSQDSQVLKLVTTQVELLYHKRFFHTGNIVAEKHTYLESALRTSLQEILPTLSNTTTNKVTEKNLFSYTRIAFIESLLGLKRKIIKKVEKLKDNQSSHQDQLNPIEEMLYNATEEAILAKFPQLTKNDQEEDKLYGYLDLVDAMLFQLGYSGALFESTVL